MIQSRSKLFCFSNLRVYVQSAITIHHTTAFPLLTCTDALLFLDLACVKNGTHFSGCASVCKKR